MTAELTIDQGRRTLIKGAGALACGLLLTVHRSDATPASMQTAIRSVFGNAEIGKGKVTIDIPSLVENGNTVPMTVSVDSPMAATDYVKSIHVFNEKNPQPNVIGIHLGPARGQGQHRDPHPAGRFPEGGGDRADERRLGVVRPGRCDRHIGGLRGGIVMTRPLINVPARAKRGQVIEIKTLISHVMETGFRPSNIGVLLPRDIITQFVCSYDGEEIFRADLFPAISANPFIAFHTVATQSGTLTFTWTGDNGFAVTEQASITVE